MTQVQHGLPQSNSTATGTKPTWHNATWMYNPNTRHNPTKSSKNFRVQNHIIDVISIFSSDMIEYIQHYLNLYGPNKWAEQSAPIGALALTCEAVGLL